MHKHQFRASKCHRICTYTNMKVMSAFIDKSVSVQRHFLYSVALFVCLFSHKRNHVHRLITYNFFVYFQSPPYLSDASPYPCYSQSRYPFLLLLSTVLPPPYLSPIPSSTSFLISILLSFIFLPPPPTYPFLSPP